MSTQTIFAASSAQPANPERGHKFRLAVAYIVATAFIVAVGVKGFGYYGLSAAERPFSPLHSALKPSGTIGLKLGIVGLACFFVIFLYPLRKRWEWLRRQGSSRHWLDFHVLLGVSAPFIIAFHASFKFRGFAGMAFWIMLAVSLSGLVGRYLYGQIPRRLNSTELSLKESKEVQEQLVLKLQRQTLIRPVHLEKLFHLPSEQQVARWPMLFCLGYMAALDIGRPFHIARLRMRSLSAARVFATLGGLLSSGDARLEEVIASAREQASLSKRLLFLSKAQKVFHLWHVVHRPFSYSFVVLVVIHITVVLMLGYM